jgi:hypothetical protein
MLLDGKTWAEAAWSSMRQLSYVNTVVGDPLMTWKTLLPGDANMDGTVDSSDLSILAAHWREQGQAGGAMWADGDFNGDGVVDASDLALLAANWKKTASWAAPGGDDESFAQALEAAGWTGSGFAGSPVPEPSSLALFASGSLLVGIVGLLVRRRRLAG